MTSTKQGDAWQVAWRMWLSECADAWWHSVASVPDRPAPPTAGIRNAAGFQFHPTSGDLLFSGMERDYMGNDSVRRRDAVLCLVCS